MTRYCVHCCAYSASSAQCTMFHWWLAIYAKNLAADALSRDRLHLFLSLNPQASPTPTLIPSSLRELVLNQELNCASQRWTELLRATLGSVLPQPPMQHTPQPSAVMLPSHLPQVPSSTPVSPLRRYVMPV